MQETYLKCWQSVKDFPTRECGICANRNPECKLSCVLLHQRGHVPCGLLHSGLAHLIGTRQILGENQSLFLKPLRTAAWLLKRESESIVFSLGRGGEPFSCRGPFGYL